jgi:hypothetical protein
VPHSWNPERQPSGANWNPERSCPTDVGIYNTRFGAQDSLESCAPIECSELFPIGC